MNGDGEPIDGGGGGGGSGPITPSSVTTPLLNATVGNITTLTSTTANIATSALDVVRFRVAEQRAPVNSSVINYRMPLVAPPDDGLSYSLCNNPTPSSVFTTPATGAAFSILLETASFAQTIRIVFEPNNTISSDFLFERINQTIASWFGQQGSQQSIFFTLDTAFFPYRTRLLISFAANRSQINVDANNQMAVGLGWPASTGLQNGPANIASPNASTITARIDNVGLLWRNVDAIAPSGNSIQTVDGISSVICNEIGTNLVSIVGSVDMNDGNIARLTSASSDASALTLNCGQSQLQVADVADGLSQSTTTYLRATDGISNAGVGCSVDSAFLIQNNLPRIIVDSTTTTMVNSTNEERIRLSTYGTLLRGGGQPGAGVACALNMDGDIFMSRDGGVGASEIFYASTQGTQLFSSDALTRLYLQNSTEPGGQGVFINPLIGGYRLPLLDATLPGQVMTCSSGVATWQSPSVGLYSATSPVTIANTGAQLTLIGAGVGSLSIPANFFTAGMAFEMRTGGNFGALNNATIRFRLTNSGTLFDSGLLQFSPSVTSPRPWNADVTFVYRGGTTMITNFNFQYNNGADARGFTASQTNNTFNPTISNTLGFTAQWGAASTSNTITSDYFVLTRLY
jgi:hypothetical protein